MSKQENDIAMVKPRIAGYARHLLVCTGPRCAQDGAAQALFDSLGEKLKAAGLNEGQLPEHLLGGRAVSELVFHQGPSSARHGSSSS